jgi:hypothetical protein
MKLESTLTADVVGITIKRNGAHDGREVFVDFDIQVDADDAPKSWGEEFAAAAFAMMRTTTITDSDGREHSTVKHLVDSISPKLIFENHRIAILDEVIDVQPELLKIKTVNGAARVVSRLRLPIDVGREKLILGLVGKVGEAVKLDCNPVQGHLRLPRPGGGPANVDPETVQ